MFGFSRHQKYNSKLDKIWQKYFLLKCKLSTWWQLAYRVRLFTSGVSPKRGIESGVNDSGPQITVLWPTLSSIGSRLGILYSDQPRLSLVACELLPDRAGRSPCWGQRGQKQIQVGLPRTLGSPQKLPGRACCFAPGRNPMSGGQKLRSVTCLCVDGVVWTSQVWDDSEVWDDVGDNVGVLGGNQW